MPIKYLVIGRLGYESCFKLMGVFDSKEAAMTAKDDMQNMDGTFIWEVKEVTHYAL